MGTTNTFTSLQPNMKDQYSDNKPKFKKVKEQVKNASAIKNVLVKRNNVI